MGPFRSQLRQVVRRLGRTPLFTLAALVTLAAGIGANTAMFSVVEGVLLKPLAYAQPEQLVSVLHTAPGINVMLMPTSPSMYFIYREQGRVFQSIGLQRNNSVKVTGTAEPEQVEAVAVTADMPRVLGTPPLMGRWFQPAEDAPGGPDRVLLTYGYWRRKFGGDRSVLGRTIRVDGKPHEIIGVTPERFEIADRRELALIMPFKLDRAKAFLGDFSYVCVARLKPGVTLAQVNADVARMIPIVNRSFPPPPGISVKIFEEARIRPAVRELKQAVVGEAGDLLWVIMGSVGVVLLIACANVANLLLVRAEGRQQELAIRAALGATRGRIAAELLSESLLLALAGGALGLALAYGGLRLLVAVAPAGLPRLNEIGIDGPVLLFALAASVLSSLLFGAVPVLKYAGARLGAGLRDGGRTLSQSRERHRARSTLVVVQVALALVLLISSGLMIRTFVSLTRVHPGFAAPAQVQTFRLSIPEAEVPDRERVAGMEDEIARRIAAIPGVAAVGMGTSVPMDGSISRNPVFAQDRNYREGELPPLRHFTFVAPGYFRTLGIPLVAGRDLTWTEVHSKRPVVIVSESLAREYWREPAGALGKRIRTTEANDWCEIVGVAGEVHHWGVHQDPPSTVYWPMAMRIFWDEAPMVRRTLSYIVRSPRAGSESLLAEIRQAVWSVNAGLPLADPRTLESLYRRSLARTSFTLVMLAMAGAMALLLGIVGLYGVIAYGVSQRRREIGIRVALGARKQELTGMFLRHGLLLTAAGVGCGLGAAFLLARLMSSLLFRVRPVDPLTYAAMSLALAATTLAATYLPARRAAEVDPVEALRAE